MSRLRWRVTARPAFALAALALVAAIASWLLVRLAMGGPEAAQGQPQPMACIPGDPQAPPEPGVGCVVVENERQARRLDAAKEPFWGVIGPFHIVPIENPTGSDEEMARRCRELFNVLWGVHCEPPITSRTDPAENPFYIEFERDSEVYGSPYYTVCANGQVLVSGIGIGWDDAPIGFTSFSRHAIAKIPVGVDMHPTPRDRLDLLKVRGKDVLVEKPVPGSAFPVTRFWVIERYPEPGRQGVLTLVIVERGLEEALQVLEEVLAVAERFPPK